MNNNSKIIEKILNESIESRIEEITKKIGEIEEVDNVDLEVGSEYEYKKTDESPTKVLTFLKRGRKSSHGPFYFLDRNGNEIMLGEKQIRQMKKKETFNLSEMIHSELEEKLHGNQTKIDKNKNSKIDAEDFKLLRKGKKSEMEEELGGMDDENPNFGKMNFSKPTKKDKEIIAKYNRNPLSLKDNKKEDEEDFGTMRSRFFDMDDQEDEWEEKMGNVEESVKSDDVIYNITFGNENVSLTENEMIDLIEEIAKEQGSTTPGIVKQKQISKKDKDINDEGIKKTGEKMSEYLKATSKGMKYDKSPKMFPKTNGDMAKKAYTPSDDVEEYISDFAYPGQTNLVFDEIKPEDEKIKKYLKGDKTTGNAQVDEEGNAYGNVVPSETGDKFYKNYEENPYGQEQMKSSYKRYPQPVDSAGESNIKGKGQKALKRLSNESVNNEEETLLTEDMDKIKKLINY